MHSSFRGLGQFWRAATFEKLLLSIQTACVIGALAVALTFGICNSEDMDALESQVTSTASAVNDAAGKITEAVNELKSSVAKVNTSVGGTTTAVKTLDESVADLARIIREIEDPKLRAGDLISAPHRSVGGGDKVHLVTKANGTVVTLRWITTWDILDQSGCEGRLIKLLSSREVNQLTITYDADIASATDGCFASLILGS